VLGTTWIPDGGGNLAKHLACPAEFTAHLISGRWKIVLLWYLYKGVQRFSDLERAIPGITHKVLTHQLREMEQSGLLTRSVYAEVPPKVEYQITSFGLTLKPVVDAMHEWGAAHRNGDGERTAS
jgi:DNA-binding HxlR family transcriptional regulator